MEQLINELKTKMPKTFKYHEKEINEFLAFLMDAENTTNHWCLLTYSESVKMKHCSDLCESIKKDVLPNKNNPFLGQHLQNRNPDNDYELGVFSTMGLIYHYQHCMNPS